jgi:hypothetical protein
LETVEETATAPPKPVLVGRKRRGNHAERSPETVPHQSAEGVAAGVPDHSRVPKPPKRLMEAHALFQYWKSIPEPERSAWFIAYVYRKYPICDVLQPLTREQLDAITRKKEKAPVSNCGTLVQPLNPDNWELEVYERWGAGDYQIRLNDQHESVKTTVTECHIRGLREWDKFPPVLELNQVVLTEETNEPYIRWARLHGLKFPGDPGTPESVTPAEGEEIEMANVVETMARQNEALTDKVVAMARERSAPVVNPPDAQSRGEVAGIETVAAASKKGIEILGDAMKQANQSQARAADPLEQVKAFAEVARAMAPPAPPPVQDNSAVVLKMMEMQMESQRRSYDALLKMQADNHQAQMTALNQRLESMERQATEARNAPRTTPEEASLDSFLRIKKKLRDAGEDDQPEEQEPMWVRLVEKGIDGLGTVIQGLAAMRGTIPPAAPTVINAEAIPAAPAPQPPKEDPRVNYAKMIHPHLVQAIRQNTPGHEFAAALIAEAGQGAYDGLANGGYNGVVSFLQSHPPLWQELILPPIGPQILEKFIQEFLDKEKVGQAIAATKGQAPPSPGPHRGPTVNR